MRAIATVSIPSAYGITTKTHTETKTHTQTTTQTQDADVRPETETREAGSAFMSLLALRSLRARHHRFGGVSMTRRLSPDRHAGGGAKLSEEACRVACGYLPADRRMDQAAKTENETEAEDEADGQRDRHWQPVECNREHAPRTAVGCRDCRRLALRQIEVNCAGRVSVAGWVQNLTGPRVRTVGLVACHKALEFLFFAVAILGKRGLS